MARIVLRIALYVIVIAVIVAGAQLGGNQTSLTLVYPVAMLAILLVYFGRNLRKRAKEQQGENEDEHA